MSAVIRGSAVPAEPAGQHNIDSLGDLLMPKEKRDAHARLELFRGWVERTGAIGKDGAWYAELEAIVAGSAAP